MGRSRYERGFTLVELMLATLLLGLLFLTVWDVFSRYTLFWQRTVNRVDMYDGLRVALGRMCREIRYAQGISAGSDANSLTLVNAGGQTVRYYCSRNQLLRQEKGVSSPLASDIESIRFTYTAGAGLALNRPGAAGQEFWPDGTTLISMITVSLTAKKQGDGSLAPVVFTQKVRLRALP